MPLTCFDGYKTAYRCPIHGEQSKVVLWGRPYFFRSVAANRLIDG